MIKPQPLTNEGAKVTRETPLQDSLDKLADEAPTLILRDLIKDKLRQLGVKLSKESIRRLADEIRESKVESFTVDLDDDMLPDRKDRELRLTFTDEDREALADRQEKLLRKIPDIVNRTTKKTAKHMVRTMQMQWHEDKSLRKAELNAFSERLIHRWSKGLTPLQLMLEVSREYASSRLEEERHRIDNQVRPKVDLVFALHMRACQVAAEILTLMEAGYADGAMARWRTLYEISTILMLISEHGDDLAQMYIDHNKVDVKKAANKYMENIEHSGYAPIPEKELAQIDEDYQVTLEKYGKPFKNEYGWAAGIVGKENPNFSDLIGATQDQAIHSVYKMASFNVHAGSRALFFRHTDMSTRSGVLAGASNAGLDSPGTHTAYTLCQITSHLVPADDLKIDDVVFLEVLVRLRRKAEKGFGESNRKLDEEEAELVFIDDDGKIILEGDDPGCAT
ncbi:MAG: DUF5677 domain-containing protein [Hyphomonas sp.]